MKEITKKPFKFDDETEEDEVLYDPFFAIRPFLLMVKTIDKTIDFLKTENVNNTEKVNQLEVVKISIMNKALDNISTTSLSKGFCFMDRLYYEILQEILEKEYGCFTPLVQEQDGILGLYKKSND